MFAADESLGWGTSAGGSPGEECASYSSNFHGDFNLRPEASESLMIDIKNDVLARLAEEGTTVPRRSGDPVNGYRIYYERGNMTGWVTISPLRGAGPERQGYVPAGALPVALDLSIAETFCPRGHHTFASSPNF